jgi:hypothetical protein
MPIRLGADCGEKHRQSVSGERSQSESRTLLLNQHIEAEQPV